MHTAPPMHGSFIRKRILRPDGLDCPNVCLVGSWTIEKTGLWRHPALCRPCGDGKIRLSSSMNAPNDVISKFVEIQTVRTSDNLNRARKLVSLYEGSVGRGSNPRHTHQTDLLRAAVVFTHACLEDFLRSMNAAFLPWADEAALNGIPLVGTSGRADKFLLGRLAQHRDKTVQELLQDSVDAHLEESNYNNAGEIARVLASLNMQDPQLVALYASLGAMIQRRHQIVHRADRVKATTNARQRTKPLDAQTVTGWIDATTRFTVLFLTQVVSTKAVRYKRVRAAPIAS